ncbi:MAG: MraY family glycosyltransferase [Candidatus Buchananbacteria bacterium]|nr:MraY family glycosyltransferase [Candidatus Buchananbacteria bacterium]
MTTINSAYFLAISISLLLALIITPLIIKAAFYFKILDQPDNKDRKIHKKAVPLLGGWAVFLSVFISIFIVKIFALADFYGISNNFILAVFVGGLLIMIGGTLDDKYNLKPWQQIVWPLLAAVLVLWAGIRVSYITNPVGGPTSAIIYLTPIWGTAISFLWLMGLMYTTKLLDGLDGLVSGVTAIAALIIFMLSLNWDIFLSATGVWALLLFGASLGFLVFNFHPAKIFLGEGGSIFMGFMLGVLSIISGSKIATTLLVVGIPALDVLWVIIRRIMGGKSPFSYADNKHLHFQLLNIGLKHREAVLLLYLVAIAFGFLGVLSSSLGKLLSLIGLIIFMSLLILLIYSQSIRNGKRQ